MTVSAPAEIQTGHLLHKNQKRDHLIQISWRRLRLL